ncbi:hypothetical protein [Evansella tamaricis]|uniref:Uncharacterized protein n=1 Tax=Evansella tamaricis TaxID=2069301 RepID=A0ABS6JCM6_9BACI|nr:hypothetical protein [Evansella tamaricis]MBU9710602.1 hypothetical protein [Evansella tamaricis]
MKESFLAIILVGMTLIILGCSEHTASEIEGDQPPIPSVSFEEDPIPVTRASYCWTNGCVDYAGPPEILEGVTPFIVPLGAELTIEFVDYEPLPSSISMSFMQEGKKEWDSVEFDVRDGMLKVPAFPGIYYYDFIAVWTSEETGYGLGDSYYAFVIEVE